MNIIFMRKKSLALTLMLAFSCILGGNLMAAYTTNYNEVDVNGNTIYYYVGGYAGNYYAYVTYATSSYNSYSGNVVIPQTVTTNDKTYTVKYIDEAAFKNSTGLTSVTLPSSIIQISKNAFEGCSGLTSINLWETSVTSIGNYVFKGCTSLESITIPATTTSLGTNVFEGCISLETITIPSLVTSIGSYTFDGCTSLTTVTINSNLTSIPSYLFRGCTSLSSVNIPSTVTSISGSAFYNCSALTSINIPSGVTSIGYQTFYGCTSLANVTYNATSCGDFSGAVFSASKASLFTVTIGSEVTNIPNNLFCDLTHLEQITLPSFVTSIGRNAFKNCSGLTSFTIPSNVTTIGQEAFSGCSGITSITIPSSVTSIGSNAFQYCTGLTEINYNVTTHADFTNSTKPFKGCSDINSSNITLNIGFNVERIPAYVFNGAKVAGEVVIPGSVSTIGTSAFGNHGGTYTSITTVYMLSSTPPTLANNSVFKTGSSSYVNIKVLSSSDESILDAYKDETYWSDFSSNISETNNFTVTNMDLTGITTPVTIPAGNTLTVTDIATNPTAANLVIEDGGQLITKSSGVNATVKKNIEQAADWGTLYTYTSDQWYFVASPVNGAAFPTGSINDQDIYKLDWANNKWLNLQHSDNISLLEAGFQRGTGYLYASKEGNTISVAGEIKPLTAADTAKVILKTTGWNLIGNPLTCKVTVDCAFSELVNAYAVTNKEANSVINPCQGIAVYGDAGTEVTFTKAATQDAVAPSNNNSLQMTLAKTITSRGDVSTKVVDNAVVSFKESKCMPKFNMIGGNTKLFIPQDDEEYSVVFSDRQGDVPLYFKANETGTYTISFAGDEMSLNGIYLIDILAEEEIDLSVNPSYTFIGSPADRMARFKIVFRNTGDDGTSDIFAYQNGNDIIVSGEGELQIFDVMGRMVSRQRVNGVETVNVKSQGVYIFRLNDKTQKIVVR